MGKCLEKLGYAIIGYGVEGRGFKSDFGQID